jgi:hypothetical protein
VAAGSLAPALRIDTLVFGPLTPEKALHLVDERRRATAGTAAAVS